MLNRFLSIAIISVLFAGILLQQAFSEESESTGLGFPNFRLEDLDGDEVSDEEAFADADIFLIDFFTYYCKPCRKMFPHLSDIQDEFGEYGLKSVLFSEDEPEGVALTRSFIKQKGYSFDVLFDVEGDVEAFFSVDKHPTTILLDADGNILYTHESYNKGDEEEIADRIREYLEEIGNFEETENLE